VSINPYPRHIIIGGASLCGALDAGDLQDPVNGHLLVRLPCEKCAAFAQEVAQTSTASAPAHAAKASETHKKHHVVISMTTTPSRDRTLGPTIASLREQYRQPDEIRLYLGPGCEDFVDYLYPPVRCARVLDKGPVTKLSAVADDEVQDDAIIVTVDDDITYHPRWLATLLHYVNEHPEDAIGMAGWYSDMLLTSNIFHRASGVCDVVEGFAGVAYHKWFFAPDVLNPPASMKYVDDVWISSYLYKAGIVRRVIPGATEMVNISRSIGSGIHTRPNFVELNKQAVVTGFVSDQRAALLARRDAALKARQ
jgi:hypothetical protein